LGGNARIGQPASRRASQIAPVGVPTEGRSLVHLPMLAGVRGVFRPLALVRGRAMALWRPSGSAIAIEPFPRLTRQPP
jgi:hypothetical protein